MFNYFNALSACYRRCSSQGEYYIKLFAIGKENPYELGEKTRSLLGFYYFRENQTSYENPKDRWNCYIIWFDFLWFSKGIEAYGQTPWEAIYKYATWVDEDEGDDETLHLGCRNYPVCDTEGCGEW